MGLDETGMPVAAVQSKPGKYHIPGCLEIAPESPQEALQRCPANTGGSGGSREGLPLAHPEICQELLLQRRQAYHQPPGGRLRGHPNGCRQLLLQCHRRRGREGWAVALHLQPSGGVWRRAETGHQDKLSWAECLARERSCPPDVSGLQGHRMPHPAPGWQLGPRCACLWPQAHQQHHTGAATGQRTSCRVGAWVDQRHRSGKSRPWQRR